MLKPIIDYIDTQIRTLNLFSTYLGLAEKLTSQQKDGSQIIAPTYYLNGEPKQINFDYYDSLIYHISNGDISRSEIESIVNGCGTTITQNVPLKIVGYFNRQKCLDSAYLPYTVCENIANVIGSKSIKELKATLKAQKVGISVTGYEVKNENVFLDQYSGIEMHLPITHPLISVSYQIIITGSLACFPVSECINVEVEEEAGEGGAGGPVEH